MKRELSVVFIGILAFLILATGFVTADPLIPAHNETMGLQIGTVASIDGQLKEDNEVVWETTNGVLDNTLDLLQPSVPFVNGTIFIPPLPEDPLFDIFRSPGEIQYTTTYTEDTAANQGHIGYSNHFALSNANKVPGESNIEATRAIVFMGDIDGSMSSSERLILDGAGQFNFAGDSLICPFGSEGSDFIPAFCNYVETGSDVLISSGSMATNAKERFVSASSDNPLTTDYLIQLSGADGPALGSVSAYMTAETREGAVDVLYMIPVNDTAEIPVSAGYLVKSNLVSDVKLHDQTSISGQIDLFEKIMHYESGVTL
jgi:hypothetical protein